MITINKHSTTLQSDEVLQFYSFIAQEFLESFTSRANCKILGFFIVIFGINFLQHVLKCFKVSSKYLQIQCTFSSQKKKKTILDLAPQCRRRMTW